MVVPQAADQPYWAARVDAPGIGAAIDNPSPTLASIRSALAVALTQETAARAHAVAETITADGAAQAAQMLYNQTD